MSAHLTITKDGISPDLLRRARAAADRAPFLKAMGTAVVTLIKQAFTDASLRPSAWAPRKDDHPHPILMGHALPKGATAPPMLWRSIRITKITASQVTLGSHLPYAATHQLGSEKLNIPPRPFFPFRPSGALTPEGAVRVERAPKAALKAKGL